MTSRAIPAVPPPPETTVKVESPLYDGIVSSQGGKLQQWTLRYRGGKPMVAIGDIAPVGLMLGFEGGPAPAVVPMRLEAPGLMLDNRKPQGALTLSGEVTGVAVDETLSFRADAYTIDTTLRIRNTASAPRTITIALPWLGRPLAKGAHEPFQGQHPTEVVWEAKGRIERTGDLAKIGQQPLDGGAWIGIGSTYYLSALIPQTPGWILTANEVPGTGGPNGAPPGAQIAVQATPTVGPDQVWEGRVLVYTGPKEYDRLARYGLQGTIDFGGFPFPERWAVPTLPMAWLGVPILKLMNFVYRHVGNYGVAIIILTIAMRILLYPLTVKSMRSMKAMQVIQPQVNALRAKYKSDPQRVQRETLELYKKHGVNPMGGCLPMVAQIPILYALYYTVELAVELQDAPFICLGHLFGVDIWICDLASRDPTYVLPILMGVSMFVQQRMTPTAGDPRQARMMQVVMPFVFTFMFMNFPSGLVLYWLMSNVLQVLQQWYMGRSASGARATKTARA